MRYIFSVLIGATIVFNGCADKGGDDDVNATYSPIITVSSTYYLRDANVTMPKASLEAEYLGGNGQYQFHSTQFFYEMQSVGGVYADSISLELTVANPTCDVNHTSTMAINALLPDLSSPDYNSSTFPYINLNIFTTLLASNSKEELAQKYPESYKMNRDFNYDAFSAALTRYSANIEDIGGDEPRDARLFEFCAAAEELIMDESVVKRYPIRVTSLHQIKDANVTMLDKSGVYSSNGKYAFEDVNSIDTIEVHGGSYITNESNESDYNSSLVTNCPDMNETSEFLLSAPKVDANKMPYIFVNPFTTLLAQGANIEDINDTYPIAYATENSFNFDTSYRNKFYVDTTENNFTSELCNAIKAIQK